MTDTNENQRYNTSEHHQDNLNDDDDVHSSTNNNSIAMLTQFFKTTGLIDKSKLIDVVRNKQRGPDSDDDEEETKKTMTMTTTTGVVVDNAAAHGNSYTESSRWNRIKHIPCLCDYFNRRDGRGGLVIISNNRHRTRQQHKQINLAPPPSRWEPWPGKKSAGGGGSHNNNNNNNNNTSKRNGIGGTGGGGVKSSLTMKKPVRQRSIVTAPVEIPSFEEMMSNSNGNINVEDINDGSSDDQQRPPRPLPRQGSGSIVCDLSPQQTHSIKMPVRQRSLENKNDNNNNDNHHSNGGTGGPAAAAIISASNTSTTTTSSPTKKTTTFWGKKNNNSNNETSIPRPLSIGGGGGGPRGGGRNLNTRYCSTPAKMPRRQKSIAQCALSAVTEEALFGDTKSEPFTTTPSADERSESPPPPAAPPLRRAETSPQLPPRHIDYGPPELVKEQKEAMFIHRRMARNRKRQGAVVIKASGGGIGGG